MKLSKCYKKELLVLILKYLENNRLTKTANALVEEFKFFDLKDATLCDNISLEIILKEYLAFYSMRFDKEPRIIKDSEWTAKKSAQIIKKNLLADKEDQKLVESAHSNISKSVENIVLKNLNSLNSSNKEIFFLFDEDAQQAFKNIELEFNQKNYNIGHNDIFKNWKDSKITTVLIYGPPGNGKTFAANGLAAKLDAKIISIDSAGIVSKWRGESEKNLHQIFKDLDNSDDECKILFFDEIDSLLGSR
ncbi:MAG: Katanin p60 ATPase-containing subunit A-like 2 [Paramarteilia canceri]